MHTDRRVRNYKTYKSKIRESLPRDKRQRQKHDINTCGKHYRGHAGVHLSWNRNSKQYGTKQQGNVKNNSLTTTNNNKTNNHLKMKARINWTQLLLDIAKVLLGALAGQQLL